MLARAEKVFEKAVAIAGKASLPGHFHHRLGEPFYNEANEAIYPEQHVGYTDGRVSILSDEGRYRTRFSVKIGGYEKFLAEFYHGGGSWVLLAFALDGWEEEIHAMARRLNPG